MGWWIGGAVIAAAVVIIWFCVWEVGRDDGYFEKTRHR